MIEFYRFKVYINWSNSSIIACWYWLSRQFWVIFRNQVNDIIKGFYFAYPFLFQGEASTALLWSWLTPDHPVMFRLGTRKRVRDKFEPACRYKRPTIQGLTWTYRKNYNHSHKQI